MAYENLCMYCFKDLGGETVCPHCGRDSRAAVPQIQMLPGTLVYRDRFLVGRALGQDASGIVYTAMDTKRGGTIRIREYLPRNCAERLNDGTVVPIAGMEDAFEAGIRKLRASVDSVEDPRKRHFFFEENGTAYIAQRKNASAGAGTDAAEALEEDAADRKKQLILYIAIGAAVVLAVAIGLIWFLNSMGDADDVTLQPLSSNSPGATWMPNQTPSPTPYTTATFAALKDPELSWMDYTYPGNVDSDYQQQASASATRQPTVNTDTDYSTVNGNSSANSIRQLQQRLAELGWLSSSQVSGEYDSATRQAVKNFQTYVNESCSPAEKLAVDGIAGKKTQQWLYNSSVSLTKPTATPTPLVTAAPEDHVVNANSSASEIRDVQKKLISLGLMEQGSDDGRYGSGTTTAVKNFQIRVNQLQGYNVLEITGSVDELTMAYLNYYVDWWAAQQKQTPTPAPVTPTATPDSGAVNAGSSRDQIAAMQEQLEAVGLLSASDVDGVYGQRTVSAVRSFQTWVNQVRGEETLAVTGECDALTRAYLDYCVENGRVVDILPTQAPTQEATQAPTQEPTQAPDPTEVPPSDQAGPDGVTPESPVESITFVQEMLTDIGLMEPGSADGNYGESTKSAIRALQEFVNAQQGAQVLEVTGLCDPDTLEYLMYCYDQGWNLADQGDAVDPELTAQPSETAQPTQAPATQAPTQSILVGPESDAETIRRLQTLLNSVGLLSADDIDGTYSEATLQAVRDLQQAVNEYNGQEILSITGYCDAETLRYLEYSYDKGMNLGDHGDAPDAESTEVPTEAPTEAPVGTIESFTVSLSGTPLEASRIELEPGRYDITWQAQGQVQSYFLYLYDAGQNLLQSAENTERTGFQLDTGNMTTGEVYELRIGALPVNGTQSDIKWQSVQLVLAEQATPEPTATAAPSVSKPTIAIGSSVYQSEGVTYVNDSTIIFSWAAEGQVESYTVNLVYVDGTNYSLGTTTDTSKTVSTSQLQPGLYKLYVGATPVGGDEEDTIWSELLFGVPEPEATATPVPTEPPASDSDNAGSQISYIDANSAPEDIQTVQMALYQRGLLNADSVEPGVLDQATLEAVAIFQEMINADTDAGLTVIDPTVDFFIDGATLALLLNPS